MIREWLIWLCGGRPMERGAFRFTDCISGKPVYYFADHYGRVWLATHAWSWFRVRKPTTGAEPDAG